MAQNVPDLYARMETAKGRGDRLAATMQDIRAQMGQRLLASGPWACLCLDHDLGTAQTGLDVLHWAIGHDCLPQRVQLVTTNPTARSKMAAALHAAGYNSADGLNFKHTDGVNS